MIEKAKVKYIQSLSQKKLRDEENVFVAEGPKLINELLEAPAIKGIELFATADWLADNPNVEVPVTETDESWLKRISSLATPNRVVGLFQKPVWPAVHLADNVTLMLENIQDPGNLGTIVRCADWFGINQVICSLDSADVYGSKALQSTMGSVSRVAVYYHDLEEILRTHPSTIVYATTLDGGDIHERKPLQHGVILVGNESRGISSSLLSMSRERITIPRLGRAESLNAAVATGIILSHLVKSPHSQHH